jgi:signal transduction histidine kinase
VTDHGIGRQPPEVEVALYFCCVEAVQNAVKHAAATTIEVELGIAGRELTMVVSDDGVGLDSEKDAEGGGLGNMRDRMDSVGGRLEVRPGTTRGTDVIATVTLDSRAEAI